jgi:protein disulfide-isomerase
MQRLLRLAAVLSVAALTIGLSVAFAADKAEKPAEGKAQWTENLKEAIAASKKTGKPILANFTGSDWCGWCIRLDKEVFSTPEFAAWAQKNVVLLTVDYPNNKPQSKEIKEQNEKLGEQFKIEGYPTIVFMTAEGKEIGRSGYRKGGPEAWTGHADKILAKARG